ncbi:MAG TPA: flagellar assembly protein FliH [Buttiauxella sp.]|jgi:flagellar biosynthesis/type III secretory pathway protein FliH
MPTSDDFSAPQWRSWQPDNLLEPESPAAPVIPTLDSAQSETQLKAELARLRQQAEQQGFSQGLTRGQEEGQKQGYEAGFEAGREAGRTQGIADAQSAQQAAMKQVEAWITAFKLSLDNLDSLVPSRLVQLALHAVQSLHGSEQVSSSNVLLDQIKRLMKQDALLQGKVRLIISPEDQPLLPPSLTDTLAAMGWEIHADPQIAPGGCRVVTDEVEFDATMETRWQTLCQLAREELSE